MRILLLWGVMVFGRGSRIKRWLSGFMEGWRDEWLQLRYWKNCWMNNWPIMNKSIMVQITCLQYWLSSRADLFVKLIIFKLVGNIDKSDGNLVLTVYYILQFRFDWMQRTHEVPRDGGNSHRANENSGSAS